MKKHLVAFIVAMALSPVGLAATASQAAILWVGYDTTTPIQRYTTGGTFLGDFGATGVSGVALDGAFAWTVQPGATDSVITKYNASQTPVATINFTSGIENGHGSPSWIEDMSTGANHTLWLAGFNGEIYHINDSGTVLSHFDSGHTYSGIEVVGNTIYTSSGITGNTIYTWDLAGNPLGTITTDMNGIGGLAYNPADNTLWAGSFNTVEHLSLTGSDLGVLTLGGAYHDGLAIGDLTMGGVPEPATWAMLLIGVGAVGAAVRSSRRKQLGAALAV